MRGINTPGFPLFCRSPSGLQTHHKGFSVPSLSHISHSDVLSIWGSITYFHLVLSFPVWASLFVFGLLPCFYFWIVSFCKTISASHFFIILLPLLYLVLFIIFVSIYFSSSSSDFFISGPLFPLLDSPVPISTPFDQTTPPYLLLKVTEEALPLD